MSKHLMTLSSWPIILSKLPVQCEKGNADDDEQEEEDLLKMNILKLLLQIFIIVNINFQPKLRACNNFLSEFIFLLSLSPHHHPT